MKTAPNEDSTADGLILLTGDKESETIRNMWECKAEQSITESTMASYHKRVSMVLEIEAGQQMT